MNANSKVIFDPNNVQENYKNYKEFLNNNMIKLDDTLNFFTNQTEEKNKEDLQNLLQLKKAIEIDDSTRNSNSQFQNSENKINKNSINSSFKKNAINNSENKSASIKTNTKNIGNISSYGKANKANQNNLNTNKKPTRSNNAVAKNLNSNLPENKLNRTLQNTANNKARGSNTSATANAENKNLTNVNNNMKKINSIKNTHIPNKAINNNISTVSKNNNSSKRNSLVSTNQSNSNLIGKKENYISKNINLKLEISNTEKKSNSQSRISQSIYEKYQQYLLFKERKSQEKIQNHSNDDININENTLQNSNLKGKDISPNNPNHRSILRDPSPNTLNIPKRKLNLNMNHSLNESTGNLNYKSMLNSHSTNIFHLNNENNTNNGNNYSYYDHLNTSVNKKNKSRSKSKNNKHLNSTDAGRLEPNDNENEIFNYEAFKNIERKIVMQKGFVDLTPIPMKKEDRKNRVDQIEYSLAERAAVLIRRIEYSHNLKNSKVELTELETKEFYLKLLVEAKTIVIQRWWRKMLRRICYYHLNAQKIQSAFRGILFREAFRSAYRNTKYGFPFISRISIIIKRNLVMPLYNNLKRIVKDQNQFEFVLGKVNLIQKTFRSFLILKYRKLVFLHKYTTVKHFNSLQRYFEKFRAKTKFISNVIYIQKIVRGIQARDPISFSVKENKAQKLFEENKEKNGFDSLNENQIIYNKKINNTNKNSPMLVKTLTRIKKYSNSLSDIYKDQFFIKYNPLLILYLSCQRLHECRNFGYKEYQIQKFYLLKFVNFTSLKFLKRKKLREGRIRNNATANILDLKKKFIKKLYFKTFKKVIQGFSKTASKVIILMRTVLNIFVWRVLMRKINRKILIHAAFKCIKNYVFRIQRNFLRIKFQIFKLKATKLGKKLLELDNVFNKICKNIMKEFLLKLKNFCLNTPQKLQLLMKISKSIEILNKMTLKKAFNSIKIIQFYKLRKFTNLLMNNFIIPKSSSIRKDVYEKINLLNLRKKQNLEKMKIGLELIFKLSRKVIRLFFEKLKNKLKSIEYEKFISENYQLKNSNMAAKEKYLLINAFKTLDGILLKKERKFLDDLRRINQSKKFSYSALNIINKIILKKIFENYTYFLRRLTSKNIFAHFNKIVIQKELAESVINNITRLNMVLNKIILQKGKGVNFHLLLINLEMLNLAEDENKENIKTTKMKLLMQKKIDKNFNMKKHFFLKYLRKIFEINHKENALILSCMAKTILIKIQRVELRKIFLNFFNKKIKDTISDIKKSFEDIKSELNPYFKSGKKGVFLNSLFSQNNDLKNKIRLKLILLGNKLDKKYILLKYFNRLKLNKISDLNKIKRIQNCFRNKKSLAEKKSTLLKSIIERMLFKYQKIKEKYFYKFSNKIIAKAHCRSALILRDFMLIYTKCSKIKRLMIKLITQKITYLNILLGEKFLIWKEENLSIFYTNNKNIIGKKLQIRSVSKSPNRTTNRNNSNTSSPYISKSFINKNLNKDYFDKLSISDNNNPINNYKHDREYVNNEINNFRSSIFKSKNGSLNDNKDDNSKNSSMITNSLTDSFNLAGKKKNNEEGYISDNSTTLNYLLDGAKDDKNAQFIAGRFNLKDKNQINNINIEDDLAKKDFERNKNNSNLMDVYITKNVINEVNDKVKNILDNNNTYKTHENDLSGDGSPSSIKFNINNINKNFIKNNAENVNSNLNMDRKVFKHNRSKYNIFEERDLNSLTNIFDFNSNNSFKDVSKKNNLQSINNLKKSIDDDLNAVSNKISDDDNKKYLSLINRKSNFKTFSDLNENNDSNDNTMKELEYNLYNRNINNNSKSNIVNPSNNYNNRQNKSNRSSKFVDLDDNQDFQDSNNNNNLIKDENNLNKEDPFNYNNYININKNENPEFKQIKINQNSSMNYYLDNQNIHKDIDQQDLSEENKKLYDDLIINKMKNLMNKPYAENVEVNPDKINNLSAEDKLALKNLDLKGKNQLINDKISTQEELYVKNNINRKTNSKNNDERNNEALTKDTSDSYDPIDQAKKDIINRKSNFIDMYYPNENNYLNDYSNKIKPKFNRKSNFINIENDDSGNLMPNYELKNNRQDYVDQYVDDGNNILNKKDYQNLIVEKKGDFIDMNNLNKINSGGKSTFNTDAKSKEVYVDGNSLNRDNSDNDDAINKEGNTYNEKDLFKKMTSGDINKEKKNYNSKGKSNMVDNPPYTNIIP